MKEKQQPEIDEAKVLFPEEQVGPYTLKPWTLTQFGQVAGVLIDLLQNLEPLGLNFDNAEKFLVENWQKLLPVALPSFPQIIAITLRLEMEEVRAMDAGTQAALGLRILIQNKDQLKNFLTLTFGGLGAGVNLDLLN